MVREILRDSRAQSMNKEGWIVSIPEPSTAALLALGLVGFAVGRRRTVARSR
jgi:hypothetical protein